MLLFRNEFFLVQDYFSIVIVISEMQVQVVSDLRRSTSLIRPRRRTKTKKTLN